MSKSKSDMRPATAEDVERGRAVFYVPDSRSKVYDLGFSLPAEAIVDNDMDLGGGDQISAGTIVTAIQAEIVDDKDVLLGFRYDAGRGVCNATQVRFRGL